jgi:sporulation protein YlmC with PRC-barrel domain
LEEGDSISFRDLIKVDVADGKGREVGHVQDMALEPRLSSPFIDSLGVHLLWTDRVGEVKLVRRAEDLVVLLPFSEVRSLSEDLVELNSEHPEFPVRSAAGMWLVRRDILDKQMVDPRGQRIQRVDDVMMTVEQGRLKIAGLEVNKGMLIASSALRRYLASIRKRHAGRRASEVIPWEAVLRVESDAIVIEEVLATGD